MTEGLGTSPNVPDVFRQMFDCFWDYLETRKAFTNLGLHVFRMYDGHELIPQSSIGEGGLSFHADDLPAIACNNIDVKPTVASTPAHVDIVATLDCAVVYAAEGDLADSFRVTKAMEVLLNQCFLPMAMMSGLDGSRRLSQAVLKPKQLLRPRARETQEITHWIWTFDVELRRGFTARDSED